MINFHGVSCADCRIAGLYLSSVDINLICICSPIMLLLLAILRGSFWKSEEFFTIIRCAGLGLESIALLVRAAHPTGILIIPLPSNVFILSSVFFANHA